MICYLVWVCIFFHILGSNRAQWDGGRPLWCRLFHSTESNVNDKTYYDIHFITHFHSTLLNLYRYQSVESPHNSPTSQFFCICLDSVHCCKHCWTVRNIPHATAEYSNCFLIYHLFLAFFKSFFKYFLWIFFSNFFHIHSNFLGIITFLVLIIKCIFLRPVTAKPGEKNQNYLSSVH